MVDTDDIEILVMSHFIQIIYTTLQSLNPLISISTIMSIYYPISATQFHGSVFNQILSITSPLKIFDFKISNSVHNHLYFHITHFQFSNFLTHCVSFNLMTSLFFTKLHVCIFLFPYIFNLNSKFYC